MCGESWWEPGPEHRWFAVSAAALQLTGEGLTAARPLGQVKGHHIGLDSSHPSCLISTRWKQTYLHRAEHGGSERPSDQSKAS